MSAQQNIKVAGEILGLLKQSKVGGFPFFMYSGAKELVAGENFLQMKVPNKKRINKIRIVLDEAQDLYNIEFYKKKGQFEMVKANSIDGIFFDQVVEIILKELGIN